MRERSRVRLMTRAKLLTGRKSETLGQEHGRSRVSSRTLSMLEPQAMRWDGQAETGGRGGRIERRSSAVGDAAETHACPCLAGTFGVKHLEGTKESERKWCRVGKNRRERDMEGEAVRCGEEQAVSGW